MTEFKRFASAIANLDLPVAVAPQITINIGTKVLFSAGFAMKMNVEYEEAVK